MGVFDNGEPIGADRHDQHEEEIERLEKEKEQLRQDVEDWRRRSMIMSVVSLLLGAAITLAPMVLL